MSELSQDEATARLLARVRTGDWLDQQAFPPLAYAVPGLIPAGFGLFVGPPKVGKSWAVLSIALAVASGGVAFGHVPVGPPRPVLYLALEDGDRRLQERSRLLLGAAPIPPLFHFETDAAEALPLVRAWLDAYRNTKPLVVIDTLGKVAPPALMGESAYARDYRMGGSLKRAADAVEGATVLVVHHDRKAATDDFVDSVSGTNGLAGSADFLIVLDRKRQENDGVLKVTGRDVQEAEYGVTLSDAGAWTLLGDSLTKAAAAASTVRATAGLGDQSSKIVGYVSEHPEGVRAADVEAETKIPAKELTVYLGRLATAGKISRIGRGLYGPAVTVVSVVSSLIEPDLSVKPLESNPTLLHNSVVTTQQNPTLTTQPTGDRWETEPEVTTDTTQPTGGGVTTIPAAMRCVPTNGAICGVRLKGKERERGLCNNHFREQQSA